MPIIMGVDSSTKTGLVCLSDDPKFFFSTELEAKKMNGFERLAWFRTAIDKLVNTYKPDICVIENYGFANSHSLVPLVEIGTTIRMVFHDRKIPIVNIAPTSLKSFVCSSGNAKKEMMILEAYKRWGFQAATNNIADAYGLAKVGQYLLGLENVTKDSASKIEKLESVKLYRANYPKTA